MNIYTDIEKYTMQILHFWITDNKAFKGTNTLIICANI